MSRLKLSITFLCGVLLAGSVAAETDSPKPASDSQISVTAASLHAFLQPGEIVGFEQIRRIFLKSGNRDLVFCVPHEFIVNFAAEDKVTLSSPDFATMVSVRLLVTEAGQELVLNEQMARAWVARQWNEPTILEASSQPAIQTEGLAFDLAAKVSGVPRMARVVFIPTPGGVLEFTVSANFEAFPNAKTMLRTLLRGLDISESGKPLKIVPFSGEN